MSHCTLCSFSAFPFVCSQQYPLAEGRLTDLIGRIAPTNTAAKAFRDLKEHIETAKVGRLH